MSISPADNHLAALFGLCGNQGRWGYGDERGTLNFITADAVLRAIRTVRSGDVVSLGRPLIPGGMQDTDAPVSLTVRSSASRDAVDTVTISPHGFEITHLDAVGHSFFDGAAYNGRRMDHVVSDAGLRSCDISVMGGIVTRGVLLDVASARGVATADEICFGDLERAEMLAGTPVEPGDAVFVRCSAQGPVAAPDADGKRPGLLADAIPWLHQRQVAVYSGDCIEQLPSPDPLIPMPLHQVGHVAMGLAILDNPDVDALRAACDRHQRADFLLMVAPLQLRGGTGSAVNPLAIF